MMNDDSSSNSDLASDDSDVEDVSHLKRLCVGFLDKMKEDKRRIKLLEKGLLNAQLNLLKREAAHIRETRQILLRDKINAEVAKEDNFGTSRDPLVLFPEELWMMIFDNVENSKTLQICEKTSPTFEAILGRSKPQWLFEKVLPYLFNKLSRKDVLTCRVVCKKWLSSVDSFLESYYSIICPDMSIHNVTNGDDLEERLTIPAVEFKEFHFEYTFNIPAPPIDEIDHDFDDESVTSSSDLNRCHDRYLEVMKTHPRNPFIGRSVTLEEDSTDFDLVNQNPNFSSGAKDFLEHFGQHIFHLSISCNMEIQTPATFYQTLLHSLTQCDSMRSLCFTADLNWRRARGQTAPALDETPPPHSNLESLSCDTNNTRLLKLLDKLILAYSQQLKRVDLRMWNPIYSNFPWNVLRQLEIDGGSTSEVLNSLLKMSAPQMRVLKICVDGKGPYLTSILKICNHFSKLCQLYINFESRFVFFPDNEVISMIPGLTASPALTFLQLTSTVTDLKDFNFLVYFPFVEYLVVRHGYWTEAPLAFLEEPDTEVEHTYPEIVRVYKYLKFDGRRKSSMYRSNVWDIMSFLYKFQVENASIIPVRKKMYTRQGFEVFRAKHGAKVKKE